MNWGERAAEQHEKDQPSEVSTCLRPDGVEPVIAPLLDRADFASRIQNSLGRQRLWSGFGDFQERPERRTYASEQLRKAQTHEDQLVLMRAAQILDEAEARRKDVMQKFAKPAHQCEAWQLQESAQGGQYCAACGKRAE